MAAVRLGTRVFVYALLLAVVLPPVTGTEHWPFTTLKLFSVVRGPEQAGWEVTMVDADGREAPLPWERLPHTFHFRGHVLRRFPSMTPREREQACAAWADAARDAGAKPEHLRVYRVVRRVPTDGHPPGPLVRRDLRYECGT
jgi:hypothetical protein